MKTTPAKNHNCDSADNPSPAMSNIPNISASLAAIRVMMTLPECAAEAGVSRRFLELEILRGRLVARKLSTRICRIRRSDWESYLQQVSTAQVQN